MRFLPIILLVVQMAAYVHGDEVRLVDGDVLHGQVTEETDEQIVLEHGVLGRILIPRAGVASVQVDASEAAVVAGQQPPIAEAAPSDVAAAAQGAQAEPAESGVEWRSHLDVSLDLSQGNTDEQVISMVFQTSRRSPFTRYDLGLDYYNKIKEGTTTDNKVHAAGSHDWLIRDSRWFYFGQSTYDYDQFESWKHRAAAHGGPGYQVVERDDLALDLRGGLGGRKEWKSENDELKLEGMGGLRFRWQINPRQTIEAAASIYPVITDPDDIRTRETFTWRLQLDEKTPLSLSLRITHEYQSIVDPEKDRHDLRVLLGLGYEF